MRAGEDAAENASGLLPYTQVPRLPMRFPPAGKTVFPFVPPMARFSPQDRMVRACIRVSGETHRFPRADPDGLMFRARTHPRQSSQGRRDIDGRQRRQRRMR